MNKDTQFELMKRGMMILGRRLLEDISNSIVKDEKGIAVENGVHLWSSDAREYISDAIDAIKQEVYDGN